MEQKDENVNTITITPHPSIDNNEPPLNNKPPIVKKKLGSKSIFKVALFLMRGRHRKSKLLAMDDGSRSVWKKFLGSMRPLHLQNNNNNSPISSPKPKTIIISSSSPCENNQHVAGDHHSEGDGFDSASEFANSPSPASSRYASAVGLNEMVRDEEKHKEEEKEKENEENIVMVEEEEDDDDNEGGKGGDGDEMIDAKAEEFIAQFYKEMKIQRLDRTNRHYVEMSMRSLGLSP